MLSDALGRFREFRRSRPFWGGLFAVIGGVEILLLPLSPVSDMVLLGVAGMSGALIGVVLVVLGVFVWFSPPNRTLAGVLTLVFSLGSFVVSNLGGLIVGMVLGLVGGGLTLAWTPDKAAARSRKDNRGGPPPGGPPMGGPAAGIVVLLGVLPALLVTGSGRAESVPVAFSTPAAPLPAPPIPLPAPPVPAASPALPIPTPPIPIPPLPAPSPNQAGPIRPLLGLPALPGLPTPLLPPLLPQLTALLPPTLLAPLQPSVAAEPKAVASGLIGELLMDTLTVTNFRYQGIVEFPVPGGGRQRALRIVVDSTDIGNLRINIPGKDSSVQIVQPPGAAHARTTRLILDCTRLKLNLFGIVPVEFTLDFPPPPLVVIPVLSATDVQIDYARLNTPSLIVPELQASGDGRPGGKRVGYSGPALNVSAPPGLNVSAPPGLRAGSRLTPAQATQLTRMASVLHRPEILRPYRAVSP